MSLHAMRGKRASPRDRGKDRWAALCADDVAGIDGDIEQLVRALQVKFGYTRGSALSDLVHRLRGDGLRACS